MSKTYLCHFFCDQQDDWAHLIPIAELIFNTSASASTGFPPFFSQFDFRPRTNIFTGGSLVLAAEQWLESLIDVQATLVDNVRAAKEFQKAYFDCHTQEVPVYEKGEWAWLLRRNVTTTCPLSKLDFKRLGPFRIDLPMGHDVYCLILPSDLSRIHSVFHVSHLLPYIDPKYFPGRIGSKAPRGPSSLEDWFWDENDIKAILGE
jgi:hypothetical protein